MNKKQRTDLIRIIAALVILIVLHFLDLKGPVMMAAYLVPYLIVGHDIVIKAAKGVINRQPFDECLLMTIATIGAMVLAVIDNDDFTEAVAVMLFYQIGEWFQSYAVDRSRKNITDLMDIRPDYANIEEDGELVRVDPDDVEIGTVITVSPGEKVPIDGVVAEGASTLDTSALTGESVPRDVRQGDEVLSGCINMTGVLRIETTKEFEESTASRILELVEDASSYKSRSENFITRFARVYTPAVVGAAVLLALVPPSIIHFAMGGPFEFAKWLYRALTFLVISCPCALVISIPLSFFAGLGGASSKGILIKGSNYLEAMSKVETMVFDKTGTLTKGVFEVAEIHPAVLFEQGNLSAPELEEAKRELLHLAAHAEKFSSHPISLSLKEAYGAGAWSSGGNSSDKEAHSLNDECSVEDVEEIAGHGVRAKVNGKVVYAGNHKLMKEAGIAYGSGTGGKLHDVDVAGTVIHVAADGKYEGYIVIADAVKEHSKEAIRALGEAGVKTTVMLTGDSSKVADDVAKKLGIGKVFSELLPADKVSKVEELLKSKPEGSTLAFAGDGINDAPVLSRADVGIAMGALGSDAAIEAADIVLMDDDPLKIAKAIKISRKCMRIVNENIWFAIGVKLICLGITALGLAGMWLAIFADVGVMVIAVMNAIRALFVKNL
jgi:Cd2+/Zn2+-exporting ATPase